MFISIVYAQVSGLIRTVLQGFKNLIIPHIPKVGNHVEHRKRDWLVIMRGKSGQSGVILYSSRNYFVFVYSIFKYAVKPRNERPNFVSGISERSCLSVVIE
jgi:hypothetical protein